MHPSLRKSKKSAERYKVFRIYLRSATVPVALTIERSLAFNKETAAAPEEPQATGTVALRETPEGFKLQVSNPKDQEGNER